MDKGFALIVLLTVFLAGCTQTTTGDSTNISGSGPTGTDDSIGEEDTTASTSLLSLSSITQITSYTESDSDTRRKYASISGDGSRIVYVFFDPEAENYKAWTIRASDTTSSSTQEKIFDEHVTSSSYYVIGGLSTNPVLTYSADYAYFNVQQRGKNEDGSIKLSGFGLEYPLGRVKLSDNSFTPIHVSVSGYDRVDVASFSVTSNNIYALVRLWDEVDVDTRDVSDSTAVVRMDLDGSNQEVLVEYSGYTNYIYTGDGLFVDESNNKLYFSMHDDMQTNYYILDMNSQDATALPEEVQEYYIRGLYQGSLILYDNGKIYLYNPITSVLSEEVTSGGMAVNAVKNGIIYLAGDSGMLYPSGYFSVSDMSGEKTEIIESGTSNAEKVLVWESQTSAFSASTVSEDGKKVLLTNHWSAGPENYYILTLE